MKSHLATTYFILSTNLALCFGGSDMMSPQTGPVGPVLIYSLGECDPAINNIDLKIELNTEDDDRKSVKATFKLPEDYGEDVEISLVADKWENNDWRKEVYATDGKYLDFMDKYFATIWENFRNAADPKMEDKNKISAGEYNVEMYQDTWENMEIPQIIYGRFLLTVTLSVGDEDIVCVKAEGEAFQPQT